MEKASTPHSTGIPQKFSDLKRSGRKALIPFFTAGYPSLAESEKLALTAISAGADLLEIGMPFSDPLADGPAIQHSSFQALKSGLKMKDTFRLVERIADKTGTPIALMGYYNPIIAQGVSKFVRSAKSAGVGGLIIPDLPPEEAAELRESARDNQIGLSFLIAPTTSEKRYATIARATSAFVYAVTVAGVTGARTSFAKKTGDYLRSVREATSKPIVAGFGISDGSTAKKMARRVDGVVVGSAFIDLMRKNSRSSARVKIGRLIEEIRKSLDSLASSANR
jgi:tryptophan synthase alpha chain